MISISAATVQTVNTFGVFVKEFFLVCLAGIPDQFTRNRNPFSQSGRDAAHWPVSTPNDTVPAELFDAMFREWPHRLDGGILGLAISEYAGNLACDIRQGGQCTDVFTPGIEHLIRNVRHAAMVQDELNIGAFPRQS